ncbi:transposase [Streptosporangium sp. KLBMP 9127]|nr:transposase [Streptosporangium sp. KLBMP 9127]
MFGELVEQFGLGPVALGPAIGGGVWEVATRTTVTRLPGPYGRGGEISTNRREEVEMTALCLRILQAALVFVNTLMLQDVLTEPQWASLLTPADRRGIADPVKNPLPSGLKGTNPMPSAARSLRGCCASADVVPVTAGR